MSERWVIGAVLLFGFLWMRTKSRALPAGRGRTALYGIFWVLTPLLLGEKWVFDRLPFGAYSNLLIELLCLGLSFFAVHRIFLRPGGSEEEAGEEPV